MTNTLPLLDTLRERGYEPQDTADADGDWFDLTASGTGTIRLTIEADDEARIEIYRFDRYMVLLWGASFSVGTPFSVILAALDAAEDDLAAERGGPLYPEQRQRLAATR